MCVSQQVSCRPGEGSWTRLAGAKTAWKSNSTLPLGRGKTKTNRPETLAGRAKPMRKRLARMRHDARLRDKRPNKFADPAETNSSSSSSSSNYYYYYYYDCLYYRSLGGATFVGISTNRSPSPLLFTAFFFFFFGERAPAPPRPPSRTLPPPPSPVRRQAHLQIDRRVLVLEFSRSTGFGCRLPPSTNRVVCTTPTGHDFTGPKREPEWPENFWRGESGFQ